MKNRELKFRQFVNGKFHYWGFGVIDPGKGFSNPMNLHDPSQQYTGLKDRNGKEIYEGDIVQPYSEDREHGEPLVVKYLGKGFTMTDADGTDPMDGIWFYKVEVIGNIWENGDLLK